METPKKKQKKTDDKQQPNKELSDLILELADYEKNVNKQMYKYNAYRKAAKSILDYPSKIEKATEAKQLAGVGDKIYKKIEEYLNNGKISKLEKVKDNANVKIINELNRVSGIGPTAARNLYESGIKSIDDLRKNINKLTHHQQIGLRHLEDFEKRIPREEMCQMQEILVKNIKSIDVKYTITIAGSFRRGAASSGDIDVLITHPKYVSTLDKKKKAKEKDMHGELLKAIVNSLENLNFITDTMAFGDTKFMGVCRLDETKPYRRIDLRLIPFDQYYCGILYFTGSDVFNKNMRSIALEKGFTLNEYSLRKVGATGVPSRPLEINSERDIFNFLEMEYKEPEERNM